MKEYKIAIYIRLSLADEDTGSTKSESDSIVNQRSLIARFLDNIPALSEYSRTEFCDDGFTGTNTNRPAFTKMMEQVKQSKYNLICVKDFSRFSRDYIEIGDCLECLFPFLGVRFISINDGYDSDDYKGTTGGLDVVMRNIVYAAYSKDLSIKTTTAKIQMMKQGKFVGSYAPYGYILQPTVRNKLTIDPEAAQIVRRIVDGHALDRCLVDVDLLHLQHLTFRPSSCWPVSRLSVRYQSFPYSIRSDTQPVPMSISIVWPQCRPGTIHWPDGASMPKRSSSEL